MSGRLSNYRLFLKEFRRTFHTTGAILPSSPGLARALARFVPAADAVAAATCESSSATGVVAPITSGESASAEPASPRRILEVGPGTGAVTSQIIASMGATDQLDMVELNDQFVAHLQKRFAGEPAFQTVADRARIIHDDLLSLPAEPTYHAIVSGLPLNNFPSAAVDELLASMRKLLLPEGTLSFFEYIAVRPMRRVVSGKKERQRLREISSILGGLFAEHEIRRDAAMLNVPPAWVHHLRFCG